MLIPEKYSRNIGGLFTIIAHERASIRIVAFKYAKKLSK